MLLRFITVSEVPDDYFSFTVLQIANIMVPPPFADHFISRVYLLNNLLKGVNNAGTLCSTNERLYSESDCWE